MFYGNTRHPSIAHPSLWGPIRVVGGQLVVPLTLTSLRVAQPPTRRPARVRVAPASGPGPLFTPLDGLAAVLCLRFDPGYSTLPLTIPFSL